MSETPNTPAPGERWRHCKGAIYQIAGIAIHSETQEPLVLYQNTLDPAGPTWARPLPMFLDLHVSGVPRFERLDAVVA